MQLLKPCVQSADNQNRTRPKVHYGRYGMTCYVLLLFALSFFSLLQSVLASFPEWRDMVMLSPAFLVISVCLYNQD